MIEYNLNIEWKNIDIKKSKRQTLEAEKMNSDWSVVNFFQHFKQKSLYIAFEMRYTHARRVRLGSLGIPTREEPGIPGQLATKKQ